MGPKRACKKHQEVLLLWLCLLTQQIICNDQIVLTSDDQLYTIHLNASTTWPVVSDVIAAKSSNFFVPQCHSLNHNFTMMEFAQSAFTVKESASSLGDVVFGGAQPPLAIANTMQSTSFDVYCGFTSYPLSAPMPGGCNLEYNFMNDPNIHTWYDGFQLWIQFQYASNTGVKCDNKNYWSRLEYTVYSQHFEDGEKALPTVVRVADIKSKGSKLLQHTRKELSKPAMIITSFPDQGLFVSVVVKDTVTGNEAAYVSTVSYGCDVNKHDANHPCKAQWYYYMLVGVIGVIGLFLSFAGHRFFVIELLVNGFMFFLMCSFIGLLSAGIAPIGLILGSVALGMVGGLIWLMITWYALGIVVLSLFIVAASTGYLLSSIIFYTPLANVTVFENSWETWILYAVMTMLVFLLIVIRSKKMNIVCCAFVGAYATISCLSLYIGGTLHHIVIEPIRRATVEQYYNAIFDAPFTSRDGGLVAAWILLMLVGIVFQLRSEKDKPDFPTSPKQKRRNRKIAEQLEERERLLNPQSTTSGSSQSQPHYGSVDPVPHRAPVQ